MRRDDIPLEDDDLIDRVERKYRKLGQEEPKIRQRINQVYEVETRLAILTAISNFGPLNIKKLAKLLDKNEATIHHHLQNLLSKEPQLLEIETKATEQHRGKYYELTPIALKYFSDRIVKEGSEDLSKAIDVILSKEDEEITQLFTDMLRKHPDIGSMARMERQRMVYNHIMENIMISNLQQAEEDFLAGKHPKHPSYPFGSLSNTTLSLRFSNPRHHFEVLRLLSEFTSKIYALQKKIEQEPEYDEDNTVDFHISIVAGEVSTFEFD